MHVPEIFKESDIQLMHSMIQTNPLGTWITSLRSQLEVNHIPFVLDSSVGPYGVLKGHINKMNKLNDCSIEDSVVVFHGASTYITPAWYAAKKAHGRVVPTYNYCVVHAYGRPVFIEDKDWLLEHLKELTHQHEVDRPEPWLVEDAPIEYIDKMMDAIIGVEINVSIMEGVNKSSQNKNRLDKQQIIQGLTSDGDASAISMASLIAKHT